jgi:hypothetical protein
LATHTYALERTTRAAGSDADSATQNATRALPGDPDLDLVINAWNELSVEARAKIVAIARQISRVSATQ